MSIEMQNQICALQAELEVLRADYANLKQTVDGLVDIRAREREAKVNKEARHGTRLRSGSDRRAAGKQA